MAALEAESSPSDPQRSPDLNSTLRTWSGRQGHRGVRILVVDDDSGIRWLVLRILEAAGYRVMMASEGAAALRAAELAMMDSRCAIHLVLTDLDMPVLDGFELGRRLAAWRPPVPVIYMSGTTYGLSHLARLSPGAHVIEKPFSAHTLLREVSLVLPMAAAALRSPAPWPAAATTLPKHP
jgi:DNA-binding response OmpR family regulator